MNATRTRASFSATCARIESPDFTPKDRRTLTASDVVREDVTQDSAYQKQYVHNVCQESFTDRGEFTAVEFPLTASAPKNKGKKKSK